jgi:hypothetical protein
MNPVTRETDHGSGVDIRSVVAGAIAASALSVLLLGFGAALGLSLTSARPYAGLSAFAVSIIVGLWFAFVHVGSFAAGGYVAGRLARDGEKVDGAASHEKEFRDGAHGFLVWGLGTLVGAFFLASAGTGLLSRGADAIGGVARTAVQSATSAASSPAAGSISEQLMSYTTDRLFRRTGGAANAADSQDDAAAAAQVARIFAVSISNNALAPADRDFIASQVASRTGLSPEEATTRVNEAYNTVVEARNTAEATLRETAERARRSTVIVAFLAAAVSLLGLVAATWAASAGGQHRVGNSQLAVFGRPRLW